MLKQSVIIILFTCSQAVAWSQINVNQTAPTGSVLIDSLKKNLAHVMDDSTRIRKMENIGFYYEVLNVDSSMKYTNAALALAKARGYAWGEARLLASQSGMMRQQGRFAEALDLLFKSRKIAETNNITPEIARAYRRLGAIYLDLEEYPKGIAYLSRALKIDQSIQQDRSATIDQMTLADLYEKSNQLDSASFYAAIAFKQKDFIKDLIQEVYQIQGNVRLKKGKNEEALSLFREGLAAAQHNNVFPTSSYLCADISSIFIRLNQKDSAMAYALKGFEYGQRVSFKKGTMLCGNLLAQLYDSTQPVTALKYYKIAAAAKDSLYGVSTIQTIQHLVSREEDRQKELEAAQLSFRNRLKLYGVLTVLAALLVVALILLRNNRQKQKANLLLQEQKEKIEATLIKLTATQAQLVQSEKMASLGELTAGIAHEIQNPLNFVNNFSEINTELIDELKAERVKVEGDRNIITEDELIRDIQENEKKINHHGKRADAIVKGMLQHSRSSSGQKEFTDINALCNEYIRLSYHGLRAKDKTFNADFKTDLDERLPRVKIVPQDIGRVLLNLFNNAFYAVSERAKILEAGFKPFVSVSTGSIAGDVTIVVTDNGVGIPQNIIDKIFQPFFTTKPTGQGTGLGLSLSYDIVKAHGGTLKVETKEGEGTTFIIELPAI